MKLHLLLLALLLIAFVKFHSSQAANILDDDYIDGLIKNAKKDDNIINGNNIKNKVQINGHTISHGNVLKTENCLVGFIMAQLLLYVIRSCL